VNAWSVSGTLFATQLTDGRGMIWSARRRRELHMAVQSSSKRILSARIGRPLRVLVPLCLVLLLATACSIIESPAARSAQRHADNAAIAMGDTPIDAPAIYMAGRVIGKGSDDTIEVLSASGTRKHGEVVLRIAVTTTPTSEFDSVSKAVRCYRYVFKYDATPEEIQCPHLQPMTVPPMSVTTTTVS
jgi:hypothetical protein